MVSNSASQYRQEQAVIQGALGTIDVSYSCPLSPGRRSRTNDNSGYPKLTKEQAEELVTKLSKNDRRIIFRCSGKVTRINRGLIVKLANQILEHDNPEGSPPRVGIQWAGRFIKRNPALFTASIPAPNHTNHEAFKQPETGARDPNRSYNIQPEANQSELSMGLQLPQRHQQSAELMFHNIKVYFENSCRNMILDNHRTLLTLNGAKLPNDLCKDFDSYCFTATMHLEKGLLTEFHRALYKATALVQQILRAEHPRTLACFLEVFIHLIQTGLPRVTSLLRDFIKTMSATVTRKGHPWSEICRLLGELDLGSLDQAMAKAWKCTTDIFDSELGTLSPLAVSVRLDYIKRVYGITDCLKEEQLLRHLLTQFGGIPRILTPRVKLNLAHNLNRQGRYGKAEEMALEVRWLYEKYEIYDGRIVERIESLKIVSRSQFNQGKTLAAEQTMREAIRMIVDQWGIQHSWVLEFKNVLEGWLRSWGREEDANRLRGEIEVLMGKDEIDEQLNLEQGLSEEA